MNVVPKVHMSMDAKSYKIPAGAINFRDDFSEKGEMQYENTCEERYEYYDTHVSILHRIITI